MMINNATKAISLFFMMLLLPLVGFANPIDINKADAETLARELAGIGPVKAQAIIEYRERYGAFRTPEELGNVKGIGSVILEKNRDIIIVSSAEDDSETHAVEADSDAENEVSEAEEAPTSKKPAKKTSE
jgi:competence protein ComEA